MTPSGSGIMDVTPSTFIGGEFYQGVRQRWHKNRTPGLIAENVAEHFRYGTVYNEEGSPEAINWPAVTAALLAEVQENRRRIEALQAA